MQSYEDYLLLVMTIPWNAVQICTELIQLEGAHLKSSETHSALHKTSDNLNQMNQSLWKRDSIVRNLDLK